MMIMWATLIGVDAYAKGAAGDARCRQVYSLEA